MAEKNKTVHMSGKRKMSIARATIKTGAGILRVNKRSIDSFDQGLARDKILEPLVLAGDVSKRINIDVDVCGGGNMSQAEAVRNAIARGLVAFTGDKNLRKQFIDYDRHLLIADVRRTEPHKPCRSAARAGKQTSKR
jgi:small subunit ribosomal protein S9